MKIAQLNEQFIKKEVLKPKIIAPAPSEKILPTHKRLPEIPYEY